MNSLAVLYSLKPFKIRAFLFYNDYSPYIVEANKNMPKKVTPQKIPEEELINWLASLLFKNHLINLKNNKYERRKSNKHREH